MIDLGFNSNVFRSFSTLLHLVTPKGVVDARHVDRQHAESDAEQIEGQETPVILFAPTRKRMIHGREDHAYLRQIALVR